jgi:FkbH-like protein
MSSAIDQSSIFPVVKSLRKEGKVEEALELLRVALRRRQLDAEGIQNAGRVIGAELSKGNRGEQGAPLPSRVLILGQCTTSWFLPTLKAIAWGHGIALDVSEGGYDTILQDLHSLPDGAAVDAVALLPWNSRLLNDSRTLDERVADELAFWRQAWEMVSRKNARLIQVGYDWVVPGPLGHQMSGTSGPVAAVRAANSALREALPAGAYFVDLEQVSGTIGRGVFYDARRYYWTKQPFSEHGLQVLSEHLWAALRALTTGPKKVLVLDLDNTLWGGVVGETGPLGVALGETPDGEAFRAFQTHLKGLARRGILLAVASKNNPADAREVFEKNPEMVLKLDDFSAFEASWEPKAVTIARMARTLELGLDSFVFFDDNPAERELIRQALPDVAVPEVSEDPAGYIKILQEGLWFEAASLTEADLQRSEQYVIERKRRDLKESFATMDDYLASLEMRASVTPIDEADMQRVVQLLGKTNQFNLTTRRHTREDVLELLARPKSFGTTLRVQDRFGDHGLVGLLIAVPDETDPRDLRIDTWLMSCRVIGRTVQEFQFNRVLASARERGYRRIVGHYIETKKNALVKSLYPDFGFREVSGHAGEGIRYELKIDGALPRKTFLIEDEGRKID